MKKKLKDILNIPRQTWRNMGNLYIAISLLSILLTLGVLFFSRGEYFSKIFFYDSLDTGMDFFHSIEYTCGRMPYQAFNTLYPPLANLFFYMLFRFVPSWQYEYWPGTFEGGITARGSGIDLRVWQPTMFLFIVFLILTSALLLLMIRKGLGTIYHGSIIGLCMLFSYGMLYAYERGNIIIVSMICSMFFVLYKDSPDKFIQEIALLSLAVGAGLKLYPAIFGILLLYDKQYAKAMRTILYGIIMFVLPVFVFREGLSGILQFFRIMTSFTDINEFTVAGFSFDKIINTCAVLINKLVHCGINKELLITLVPKLNIIITCFVLLCGFFVEKYWQRVLICSVSFLLYQTQGVYSAIFLLIPLLVIIKDEGTLTKKNIVPFTALTASQLLLPIVDTNNSALSLVYGRFQFCIALLLLYILVITIKQSVIFIQSKTLKHKKTL